jgi:hypothetical protein
VKQVLSRRELFRELLSKDTVRQVASAWYGFTQPFSEQPKKKQESLLDKVKKIDSKFLKNDKKNG